MERPQVGDFHYYHSCLGRAMSRDYVALEKENGIKLDFSQADPSHLETVRVTYFALRWISFVQMQLSLYVS